MSKLSSSINSIELKSNKTITSTLPSSTWTDEQYPDAVSLKNFKDNIINELYPVGYLYKTTSSTFNPSTAGWKGTWTLVDSSYDTRHVSSQVLHPGLSGTGPIAKTKLIGCYDLNMFNKLYNVSEFAKSGYHIELRVGAMISTADRNYVTLYLNNIKIGTTGTWSGATYRVPILSDSFRPEDITLDTTIGYTYDGVNLCYEVVHSTGATTYRWDFWDVCLHAYMVSDDCIYTWKRTA